MTNSTTTETICVLRDAHGFNFNRYVDRTFKDSSTAHAWLNKQYQNYNVRIIEGRHKVGDVIPMGTPSRAL